MTTLLTIAGFLFALFSAAHAVQYKRDTRSVIAWVWFIILLPLAGPILYWLLGVNRIHRRATALRGERGHIYPHTAHGVQDHPLPASALRQIASVTSRLSPFPLVAGNHVEILVDGDEAYPSMLTALEQAQTSIALATYIFDDDEVGREFAEAIESASARGVDVRILIDGVGARYSRRSMIRRLRDNGINCRAFLPVFMPRSLASFNMRNHRKLLIVDGQTGYTGGMNLRVGHRLTSKPLHPIRDLHIAVKGPVVKQMQQVFADDWLFASGETLAGDTWFPELQSRGDIPARGLPDGPDEYFEALRMTRLGALAAARESALIVTPYFLPDDALVAALNSAALRGVEVEILVPEFNNIKLVQWASTAQFWQLLERGCRIWLTPPPFDHSKLLLIDNHFALIGSANWDPRSLRLNFEFEVELYDDALGAKLQEWGAARLAAARPITLQDVDARPLSVRLRDGTARLLTPYL
jgi:cardiolipin synthase A/B